MTKSSVRRRLKNLRTSWVVTLLVSILAVGVTATAASAVGERTGWADAGSSATASTTAPERATTTGSSAAVDTDAGSGVAVREALERASARKATLQPNLLVRVPRDLSARARPDDAAPVVGVVPDDSKYYGVPTVAWVEKVSPDGRWGRVQVPYVSPRRDGWIPIQGLERRSTWVSVHVDISARRVTVVRRNETLFSAAAAVGSPSSPTPPGRYFVTDRIPFSAGYVLGSFAFGISGIQPNLPAGWSGGNQLAIHGTNNPSSIGQATSAGCMRVAEAALAKLKPLLTLGTPVVVVP